MFRRWWRVLATTLLAVLVLLPGPGADARAAQLVHVVQPDESLESIARRYGIDPSRLAERNGLSWPYNLEVGQTLLVAGDSAGSIPLPRPAPAPRMPAHLPLLPAPTRTLQVIAWQHGTGAGLVQWTSPLASLAPWPGFALLVPVRAPGAQAEARQACIEWPAAGEALVARVNNWGIGLAAFERRWSEVLGGLRYAGVNVWSAEFQAIEPQARRSVVNEMVDQVLVQQWAARTGTTVSAADIDAWLQSRVRAAGGEEPLSAWLGETWLTWEGYQQQGCHELLRQALALRLSRGSQDPEIQDEALAGWLSQRRSSSSIELYAAVAGAAGNNWSVAGPGGRQGVSQTP
ncbi:MAG: LysM peptidoglycan-binding domain-containing protein [Anaerolineae bacterium]|nr:LysM peptidoglycan-binding domain-containing protein [Anaerolineae bacterium]